MLYLQDKIAPDIPKSSVTSALQMTIPPRVAVVVEQVNSSRTGGALISMLSSARLLLKILSGWLLSGIQRTINSTKPVRTGVTFTWAMKRLPTSFPPGIDIDSLANSKLFCRSRISRKPLPTPGARFSNSTSTVPFSPTESRSVVRTWDTLTSCNLSLYAAILGSPTTVPIQDKRVLDAA